MGLCARASAASCILALSGNASSNDTFCVRTVSTEAASQLSGGVGTWSKGSDPTNYSSDPLIYAAGPEVLKTPAEPEKIRTHIFGYSPDNLTLTGPYGLDYRFESSAWNPNSGVLLILGERENKESIGLHTTDRRHFYEKTLFQFDFTHKPSPLPREVSESKTWPTAISWSGVLDGFLISSARGEFVPQGVRLMRNQETIVLKDLDKVRFAKDLPSHGVVALFDGYHLRLIDRSLKTVLDLPLMTRGDGFRGVLELQDDWVYFLGDEISYAVHLVKGPRWSVDKIVTILRDPVFDQERSYSPFRAIEVSWHWLSYHTWFGSLLGKNNPINRYSGTSDPIHVHGGAQYSAALKTIFLNDERARMASGKLMPFDRFDWFVGDVPYAGLTLFWDEKGLYSYDGKVIRRAEGAPLKRGVLTVLPNLRRAFYAQVKGNAIYELVTENGAVKPKRLESIDGEFRTEFYEQSGSDAVAVLTRDQIFSLQGNKIRSVWKTRYDMLNADFRPVQSSKLKGVLFSTSDPESSPRWKFVGLHWLGLCSNAPRAD